MKIWSNKMASTKRVFFGMGSFSPRPHKVPNHRASAFFKRPAISSLSHYLFGTCRFNSIDAFVLEVPPPLYNRANALCFATSTGITRTSLPLVNPFQLKSNIHSPFTLPFTSREQEVLIRSTLRELNDAIISPSESSETSSSSPPSTNFSLKPSLYVFHLQNFASSGFPLLQIKSHPLFEPFLSQLRYRLRELTPPQLLSVALSFKTLGLTRSTYWKAIAKAFLKSSHHVKRSKFSPFERSAMAQLRLRSETLNQVFRDTPSVLNDATNALSPSLPLLDNASSHSSLPLYLQHFVSPLPLLPIPFSQKSLSSTPSPATLSPTHPPATLSPTPPLSSTPLPLLMGQQQATQHRRCSPESELCLFLACASKLKIQFPTILLPALIKAVLSDGPALNLHDLNCLLLSLRRFAPRMHLTSFHSSLRLPSSLQPSSSLPLLSGKETKRSSGDGKFPTQSQAYLAPYARTSSPRLSVEQQQLARLSMASLSVAATSIQHKYWQYSANPKGLLLLLQEFTKRQLLPSKTYFLIHSALLPYISHFSPKEMAILFSLLCALDRKPYSLLYKLSRQLIQPDGFFQCASWRTVATLAGALSRLHYFHRLLFRSLCTYTVRHAATMDCISMQHLSLALSRLGICDQPAWRCIAEAAKKMCHTLTPPILASLAYSFGSVGILDVSLMTVLAEQTLQMKTAFTSRTLVVFLDGCALMGYFNQELYYQLLHHFIRIGEQNLPSFLSYQLSRVMLSILLEFPSFLEFIPPSMISLVEKYNLYKEKTLKKVYHHDLQRCLESLSLSVEIFVQKGPYLLDACIRRSPEEVAKGKLNLPSLRQKCLYLAKILNISPSSETLRTLTLGTSQQNSETLPYKTAEVWNTEKQEILCVPKIYEHLHTSILY
ncbi:hypothetical protein IE077_000862 [Cardiosporidium cionae]|uniref:Uncharacterized protein n=1 Tax=Cardiosporidium cionae TaxID=476202 RepID=A0ABQ7JE09_9APIC|nr:hypothetical protein IE077_000862 [Cardiosporidium cionae]|eukprot:KAF8822183.1 hypothetical protein IE077_000862 [Cardiosporidium cionae]